jgi:hypothetical protein
LDQKLYIHCHSRRKRKCDPDGVSVKAAIDGLVKAGILEDDSGEFIKEVRLTQEIDGKKDEETVITIYRKGE